VISPRHHQLGLPSSLLLLLLLQAVVAMAFLASPKKNKEKEIKEE